MSIEINKDFFSQRVQETLEYIENGPAYAPGHKYAVRYAGDVQILLAKIGDLEEQIYEREKSKAVETRS